MNLAGIEARKFSSCHTTAGINHSLSRRGILLTTCKSNITWHQYSQHNAKTSRSRIHGGSFLRCPQIFMPNSFQRIEFAIFRDEFLSKFEGRSLEYFQQFKRILKWKEIDILVAYTVVSVTREQYLKDKTWAVRASFPALSYAVS
jgi:hypothetical protein